MLARFSVARSAGDRSGFTKRQGPAQTEHTPHHARSANFKNFVVNNRRRRCPGNRLNSPPRGARGSCGCANWWSLRRESGRLRRCPPEMRSGVSLFRHPEIKTSVTHASLRASDILAWLPLIPAPALTETLTSTPWRPIGEIVQSSSSLRVIGSSTVIE